MISSKLYQPLVYFYLVAPCFTSISQKLVRLKGEGKQYVVFPPTRQNFLCLVRFQGEILISPQTGYIPDVKTLKKERRSVLLYNCYQSANVKVIGRLRSDRF